jgi:ABC-type Zn uptake system ZnuABC Zn-binding protein ZnuA
MGSRWWSSRAILCALVLGVLSFTPAAAQQRLHIVTTTTDLASLAQAVAGDVAAVESIIPPAVDPEAFEPRPSDLGKLKGAAIVVRVGLGFDHWLDKLLFLHGDASVNRRGPGYVDASLGIPLLEIKGRSVEVGTQDGHAHGLANPHYWLDPAHAEIITAAIAEAVIRVAPASAEKVIANRDRFLERLRARLVEWQQQLAPYRAAPLLAYHNTWPYFARRFRLDIIDVIEVKEGVAPSPARLAQLARTIREKRVRAILHETYEPEEASQLLARRTGIPVLKLATSVGSAPEAGDYLALFDHNVGLVARALAAASN